VLFLINLAISTILLTAFSDVFSNLRYQN
jgi:hypothetical protein